MASITRRKTGWQAEVRHVGRPTVSRMFHSRLDALKWARSVESSLDRGTFVDLKEAERTTLREAITRYKVEVSAHKKGRKQEASVLDRLATSTLGGYALARIRSAEVASYRDERGAEVGPATVARELAVLSHIFTAAAREWRMEGLSNPVAAIRKPRLPRGRERRVERLHDADGGSELDRIIAATDSAELPAILRLLVETAMRRSELASLRWSQVNLAERWIRLHDTKNGHARTVPLTIAATSLLAGLPRRIDGRVFGMTPDAVTRAFIRARTRAGIPDLRLHDLRREGTSQLFEKGLNTVEVATITGHRTLSMLQRYTALRSGDLLQRLG